MKWQSIESAPEGLHLRAIWIFNIAHKDYDLEVHVGYVDDDGCFVNKYGDDHGWKPDAYFGWAPLPEPPEVDNNG